MVFMHAQLRRLAAIALMAMLVLAFAPALSHALAKPGGSIAALGEVCTPAGLQRPAVDGSGGDSGVPMPSSSSPAHCPWCTPATAVLGPPPAVHAFTTWAVRQAHGTEWSLGSLPVAQAWPRVWPRAPPAMG